MSIQDTLNQAQTEAAQLIGHNANLIQNVSELQADNAELSRNNAALSKIAIATAALLAALRFQSIKVGYKFGAEWENDKLFDCSSLMQRIFYEAGVTIPRSSAQQSKIGKAVDVATLGCLVIIDRSKDGVPDHVGMALDDKYMIHIAGSPEGINVCKFRERYAGQIMTIRDIL